MTYAETKDTAPLGGKVHIIGDKIHIIARRFSTGRDFEDIFLDDISSTGATAEYADSPGYLYLRFWERIKSFENYVMDWDSFGSKPPNVTSINHAQHALRMLRHHRIFPEMVNPSSDEGIVFEFFRGDRYYLFEFYNDGDIVFLRREGDERKAEDISINDLEEKILEIKNA